VESTNKREAELSAIRQRCITILDFLVRTGERSGLVDKIRQVVQTSYERHDLRGLRMVVRDLEESISALPARKQKELDAVLHQQGQLTRTESKENVRRRVEGIVQNGKIRNAREFALLLNWADAIHADDSKREDLEQIDLLLAAFHSDKDSNLS
jgi:hypothetical protein